MMIQHKMLNRAATACLALFLLTGCSPDNDYVAEHEWKYYDGNGWIADWLSFAPETHTVVKNDTIFIAGKPKAIITGIVKSLGDNKLIIRSLATNERGIYCEKGKR